MAAEGTHPKVIQSITRHGDINLTMSRYTHVFRGQESEAAAGLPDLSLPSSQRKRAAATGTDGKADLASYLACEAGQHRTTTDSVGQANLTKGGKNRVSNERCRDRTCDLLIKSQLLYRLS